MAGVGARLGPSEEASDGSWGSVVATFVLAFLAAGVVGELRNRLRLSDGV